MHYTPNGNATRLLQESNSQLEPYFPLPARFGPWLTWGTGAVGMCSFGAAVLNVYLTQPAPVRYDFTLGALSAASPARDILGTGLCMASFSSFVITWSVFHALELRLQGVSTRSSLANKLAYRLGSLLALSLFASGTLLHIAALAEGVHLAALTATACVALVYYATVTSLVHANQAGLLRSTRDFFWLQVKKVLIAFVALVLLVRLVLPTVWARLPVCAMGALEALSFLACCFFEGTFGNELRHFSLQLQPVIVL
mmetsp:Transcript_28377/g.76461  ORF Transcript_28377/g.76461 Transcript_28377/m.76461 type:complete len:255 (+) Transcript_28377:106-870(+)